MAHRGVKLLVVMQMDDRSCKERLRGAIFGPALVPFVDVGVMECLALRFQLIPLHARMQDRQNVVEDVIERQLRLRPCFGPFQMGINLSIKVFTRDFRGNPMVDK